MSIGRVPGATGIQPSIVDAKGDIIAATAADSVSRLAVGANDTVLTADSSTATGLKWATPASGMSNPMTTTGDVIYSSSGSTPARLGIGSTGNILTVSGGLPIWAAPASATESFSLLSTTTLSGGTTTVSGLSGKNTFYFFIDGASMSGAGQELLIRFNTDSGNNYKQVGIQAAGSTFQGFDNFDAAQVQFAQQGNDAANTITGYLMLNGANATTIKPYTWCSYANGTNNKNRMGMGRYLGTSVISSVSVVAGSGTFDAGSILVYGA